MISRCVDGGEVVAMRVDEGSRDVGRVRATARARGEIGRRGGRNRAHD